ncbi:MAG: hypothetical protein Q9184_007758 [Pyrenodesmia sp. 2 TL-2023]
MSRPVWPKFNPQDGYIDDKKLAEALGRISVGSPETYGGKFLDQTTVRPHYQSFNMHTPPDITQNTRILAVCGISQKDAAPQGDGWFLSDFFAFYHLFHGLGRTECWMHCLDLKALVTQHRAYLHGSPFKTRKFVMDGEILDNAKNLLKIGLERYREMFDLIVERSKFLFPAPLEDQGRPFYKGKDYLVAAFYLAKLKKPAIIEKLDHLVECVHQDFEYEKAFYKEMLEVKSKRQKLYRAYGIVLGAVSPSKRQSRGKSLGQSGY